MSDVASPDAAPPGRRLRDPVTRAFDVLRWMVDAEGSWWGLREMAKGLEMHPSTLHRVIAHLLDGGVVRQDLATGRYGLGLEFLSLAWKAAGREPIRELALPSLRGLVGATGETAILAVYDPVRRERMVAAVVDSPHAVRHVRRVGEWMPAHAGANGLAILAFRPEPEQHEILSGVLAAVTPHTITDPATLRAALLQFRRQGYAIGRSGATAGAVGVAAPILGGDRFALASIGVTQPEQRFGPGDEDRQAGLVVAYASQISEQLRTTRRTASASCA